MLSVLLPQCLVKLCYHNPRLGSEPLQIGRRPMYQCILVGTDGSQTAELAVQHAINLAALSKAELHIASVATDLISTVAVGATGLASGVDFDPEREIGHSNQVVEAAAAAAREKGVNTRTHAVTGDVVDALCHLAANLKADLLVVGNRGMQGLQRFVWSSVPDSVSHRAPCSVLIVDTRDMP
jgi:nucleotide-binding universal stress UspA family protein